MRCDSPISKFESEIELNYAKKMAEIGPFRSAKNSPPSSPLVDHKSGHWSEKENTKYYAFLKKFRLKFEQKQARRQWKVFKTLADFIKTRNPNQCRSHHHKMQKNFDTVEETLNYLQEKIPSIEHRYTKYEQQLKNIELANGPQIQDDLFRNTGLREPPQKVDFLQKFGPCHKNSDHAFFKTRDTYAAEQKQSYFNPEKVGFLFPKPPSSLFAPINPMENNIFQLQPPYPVDLMQNHQNSQQWKQCHFYFAKWWQKLSSLIEGPQKNVTSGIFS